VDAQSNSYVYIKDLRRVQSHGYPVERITILDDSPEKIARQPRNHLRVKPYYGLDEDRELLAISEEVMVRAKRAWRATGGFGAQAAECRKAGPSSGKRTYCSSLGNLFSCRTY
jgi:hypothetical protein